MAIKRVIKAKDKLEKVAETNTNVTLNKSGNTEEIKTGVAIAPTQKQDPRDIEPDKIGLSKGVTVNLGDYQSLRVDCWLTTSLENGENEQQALERISTIIDKRVNLEVDLVQGDMTKK